VSLSVEHFRCMAVASKSRSWARSIIERIQGLLPRSIRTVAERARTNDVFTYAAALAFYAIVSIVPLTIVVLWIVSVVLGDDRVRQLAREVGRVAPKDLGADHIVQRVAQLGTRLGIVAIIAALWPATAYGAGLERAFDRLRPRSDNALEGLRGRALFFMVLLPVFVLGSLLGSFVGSEAVGKGGLTRFLGYAIALATGFVFTALALILIYRIFPPGRLAWKGVLRATAIAAAGISVLSFLFFLYVSLGANFEKHYATSGLAALVLLAVWLFLANVFMLAAYRIAVET
jgi:YihY family inner membrane protein